MFLITVVQNLFYISRYYSSCMIAQYFKRLYMHTGVPAQAVPDKDYWPIQIWWAFVLTCITSRTVNAAYFTYQATNATQNSRSVSEDYLLCFIRRHFSSGMRVMQIKRAQTKFRLPGPHSRRHKLHVRGPQERWIHSNHCNCQGIVIDEGDIKKWQGQNWNLKRHKTLRTSVTRFQCAFTSFTPQ